MKRWQQGIWVVLLILLLGIGFWFGLPPLERAFAPQVTVAEIRTSPEQYVNRVVELHGNVHYYAGITCGIPGGGGGMLLTDTPELWPYPGMIEVRAGEGFPFGTIELRRGSSFLPINDTDMSADVIVGGADVIVWGRLLQYSYKATRIECPGMPTLDIPAGTHIYLDIQRVQLPDGRVLP